MSQSSPLQDLLVSLERLNSSIKKTLDSKEEMDRDLLDVVQKVKRVENIVCQYGPLPPIDGDCLNQMIDDAKHT